MLVSMPGRPSMRAAIDESAGRRSSTIAPATSRRIAGRPRWMSTGLPNVTIDATPSLAPERRRLVGEHAALRVAAEVHVAAGVLADGVDARGDRAHVVVERAAHAALFALGRAEVDDGRRDPARRGASPRPRRPARCRRPPPSPSAAGRAAPRTRARRRRRSGEACGSSPRARSHTRRRRARRGDRSGRAPARCARPRASGRACDGRRFWTEPRAAHSTRERRRRTRRRRRGGARRARFPSPSRA